MSDRDLSSNDVCRPCPHDSTYRNGWQFSDRTCPLCLKDAEIERLRAAIQRIDRIPVRPPVGAAYVSAVLDIVHEALLGKQGARDG